MTRRTKSSLLLIFLLTLFITMIGVYYVFDQYLSSVGRELVNGWMQSEAVSIQEGNLLSSISKNQRVLLSSQFIRGIALFDASPNSSGPLLEVGEKIELPTGNWENNEDLTVRTTGFLNKLVIKVLSDQPRLLIVFSLHSFFLGRFFIFVFVCLGIAVASLILVVNYVSTKVREIEYRNKIMLGDLAIRVAHDIRSPLSALNLVVSSLKNVSDSQRALLKEISSRINKIASDLLEIGKEQARSLGSGCRRCEIAETIDSLIKEKKIEYEAKFPNVSMQLNIALAKPIEAAIEKTVLQRIISNLLNNAAEATASTSGTVGLKASIDGKKFVKITICDNGVGIPKHVLAKLGKQRISHGKNGEESGSGIGVLSAQQAISNAGGKVLINSVLGAGTEITIFLPIFRHIEHRK